MDRLLMDSAQTIETKEKATEAEERDHIAWALARNEPADPGSTPLQRIQAGANRSHE